MAVLLDASSTGGTTAGTTITISHTVAVQSNRALFVAISASTNVSGVTFNSVAMSFLGSFDSNRIKIYKLVAPTEGTYNVVVTIPAGDASVVVSSWYNVNQSTPNSGGAGAYGDDITVVSAAGNKVLAFIADSGGLSNGSVTYGKTFLTEFTDWPQFVGGHYAVGAASVAMTATRVGGNSPIVLGFSINQSNPIPITDLDTDEDVYPSQTGAIVTATNLEASQGTGSIVISPTDNFADGDAETQTITSWADTAATLTITQAGLPFGSLYILAKNNSGDTTSLGLAITLSSAIGKSNVTLTSVDAGGLALNFIGLAIGDQIEYETTSTEGGTVSVALDGTFEISYAGDPPASDSFQARAWDQTDYTWTSFETININSGGAGQGLHLRLSLGL